MVRRAYAQRSVFEVLLPDGDKLWDAELRAIDEILDDDDGVDLVDAAFRRRHPTSGRRGRLGTPATVVLRMLLLKHLRDWSFDECEREVRGSLVYRAFCQIDCERVPDAKTLLRLAQLIGPETLKPMLERMVGISRQRRVTRGHRLRVDTTVVETNIHYPTDSLLLADGVRALTRFMKRLAPASARTRQTYGIARAASLGGSSSSSSAAGPPGAARRQAPGDRELGPPASSRRRAPAVLKGDTHHPDKVLSIFEPHTEVIRKGEGGQAHGVRQRGEAAGS